MGVYEDLGVKTIINAMGTITYIGGSIVHPKVMKAMEEASRNFVNMEELIEKAGNYIAEVTGAEAGLVTAGCYAALVVGTAACIMKGTELENIDTHPLHHYPESDKWMKLIQMLPDAEGLRNKIIVQRGHYTTYEHAYRVAGGKLVKVGSEDSCPISEIEEAIDENTAAIAHTVARESKGVPLKDVIALGKKYDVPVIVDAAAELPPRENLKKFISMGADLVAFSGGKAIRGPNDTGFLCGRKDLIKLAAVQAFPYHGIGRIAKVDRTQIVGLITALKLYLEMDEEEEYRGWRRKADYILNGLVGNPMVKDACVKDRSETCRIPYCHVKLNTEKLGVDSKEFAYRLREGDPSVWVLFEEPDTLIINPSELLDGEEEIVVSSIRNLLSSLQ